MKTPSIMAFGFIGVAATLAILIVTGGPDHITPPPQPTMRTASPGPSQVVGNGLTLTSTSVDLPDDAAPYPDGPHADVINANCASCHSASMVLKQPALTEAQWTEEVGKMRNVYKAPVAESDVPAIIAYLTATSAKLSSPTAAKAAARPAVSAPDMSGGTG